MAVPMVFLNGQVFGSGRMLVEEIVAKLDTKSAESRAAKLSAKDPFDVLMVGGGPAGAAAAVYAARKGIRTGVAAERFGGQTNDTMAIENYISVLETDGPKFAAALEAQVRHYEVDIMNLQRPTNRPGRSRKAAWSRCTWPTAACSKLAQRHAVHRRALAQCERARRAEYKNKGRGLLPALRRPAVQGQAHGGDRRRQLRRGSGHRPGRHRGARDADRICRPAQGRRRAGEQAQEPAQRDHHTNAQTTEITGDGSKVNGIRYKDRVSGPSTTCALEGVFVQIGLVPNTEWLKGTVELSRFGEIVVDAKGHTSVPGVFATAGDCTTVPYKQIVIARVGEGAKAALSADLTT
jgi:NADH-dependent peroxiredoxin subunit F